MWFPAAYRCSDSPLKNEIPKSFPLVFGAFDAKSPSTPGEETTPGTPTLPPTPTALFPGTPTPCKGLGTTYGAGEETASLGQRANEEDTKGPPGFERSSGWDPGPPSAENPSPEATDADLDSRPPAVLLRCDRCGTPVTLNIHIRYFCPKCVSPTTCKASLSQIREERVWFTGCPPRQVVMQQWRLREAEDWRREIEERHRPKPESTVDHSPMVIPTPRALSAAKQAQLKHIDEDDERNDEKDDETPKNDLVGDRNATDLVQDAENSLTHTHTPGAHTPGAIHTHTHTHSLSYPRPHPPR